MSKHEQYMSKHEQYMSKHEQYMSKHIIYGQGQSKIVDFYFPVMGAGPVPKAGPYKGGHFSGLLSLLQEQSVPIICLTVDWTRIRFLSVDIETAQM